MVSAMGAGVVVGTNASVGDNLGDCVRCGGCREQQ